METVIGIIIALITALVGQYFYTKKVMKDNAILKTEKELGNALSELDQAKKNADASEADYIKLRDEFLGKHDKS